MYIPGGSAARAEWRWGSRGGAASPLLQLRGLGKCRKLPGDPGRAPAAERFSWILEVPDGFSWNLTWLSFKLGGFPSTPPP